MVATDRLTQMSHSLLNHCLRRARDVEKEKERKKETLLCAGMPDLNQPVAIHIFIRQLKSSHQIIYQTLPAKR